MNKEGLFTNVHKMVQLAVLVAITLLMVFTPLGFLKVGIVEITFFCIPIAVGAVMLGPKAGMILSGLFGLASFAQALFGLSPFGVAMLELKPIACFIVAFGARLFIGPLTAWLAKLLTKKNVSRHAVYLISCGVCSILNTVLFCGLLMVFYGGVDIMIGETAINVITGVVLPAVGLNGILEAVSCMLIGTAVCEALAKVTGNTVAKKKATAQV